MPTFWNLQWELWYRLLACQLKPVPTMPSFKMMQQNPGYDVVIYPQVESYRHAPVLGTDIYSKTTYKVTARLGKLKKK